MSEARFKHIAVSAAEDDDVIIMAGARPAAETGAGEGAGAVSSPTPVSADGEPAAERSDAGAGAAVVALPGSAGEANAMGRDSEGAPAFAQPETAGIAAAAQPETAHAPKREEPYRETTMEDLESGPMPAAQRIVIIAAVVCIIGALVYYFAFMR